MRVTDSEGTFYPIKKSTGKTHKNGLKSVKVVDNKIVCERTENLVLFNENLCEVDPESEVIFK